MRTNLEFALFMTLICGLWAFAVEKTAVDVIVTIALIFVFNMVVAVVASCAEN